MIRFPVFRRLEIRDYALFPGPSRDHNVTFDFRSGTNLIAGVNGLGKTTLVTMLLRSLTGPFDLLQSGAPRQLEGILRDAPVRLNSPTLAFFSQRVADRAAASHLVLTASFGSDELRITRRLKNLELVDLHLNGEKQTLAKKPAGRENEFQNLLSARMSLTSFVDVLLVLHYVVFFMERTPGALWQEHSQRQLLRIALLDRQLAARIPGLERQVSQTDSAFRRARTAVNKYQKELAEAHAKIDSSDAVQSVLTETERDLTGAVARLEGLQTDIGELAEMRARERLAVERAKIAREEAEAALDRQKHTVLLRLFPSILDAARLTLARLLTEKTCLVCGTAAGGRRQELERQIYDGICPACGNRSVLPESVVPAEAVESARLEELVQKASSAGTEESAAMDNLAELTTRYDALLREAVSLRKEIDEKTELTKALGTRLPDKPERIAQLEQTVAILQEDVDRFRVATAGARKELATAYETAHESFVTKTSRLSAAFGKAVTGMLAEEAELVKSTSPARLTQDGEPFEVFGLVAEMTAAARPGRAQRKSAIDVSESQRELLDLAFRMALMDVAGGDAGGTLVMETPEASLDPVALKNVGCALFEFARRDEHCLVVTSNLTNAPLIGALFGGGSPSTGTLEDRIRRTLNLLDVAMPNRALEENRTTYDRAVRDALAGRG